MKGKITVMDSNNAYDKKLAFKNNAPFVSCISKINNTFIDNAEDFMLLCPYTIYLKFLKVFGITTENTK